MSLVKRKKWDKTVKQKKNEGSKYVKQKIEDFIMWLSIQFHAIVSIKKANNLIDLRNFA